MAILKEVKAKIMQDFAKNAQDTGSVEVQVALLTKNIQELTGHCKDHPHDFSSNRGLRKMVDQRKKLLRYLESKDSATYKSIINKLGLRK